MSNTALPKVGVDLVALGAADYLQALKEANTRMLESTDAAKRLVAELSLLPVTNQKAQQTIAILTNQIAEQQAAVAKLVGAMKLGSDEQAKAVKAYLETNDAIRQTIASSKELTGVGPKVATGVGSVTREARGLRDALFGAGLGISLLDSALGDQLPDSAKKATNSLRLTADTMLAFAFLAPESGPVGLAIGALIGLLTSLGIQAIAIDPQVKALTDDLDKLGKKNDSAQGLAKLTGVSAEDAGLALDYLKANQSLAESFQQLAQNAQAPVPVLQGLGDAFRAVNEARESLVRGLQNAIPAYKAFVDTVTGLPEGFQKEAIFLAAYKDALLQGKSALEAYAIALRTVNEVMGAQGKATSGLAERTAYLAGIQKELSQEAARVTIKSAQETIDKLRLEGATIDELNQAYGRLVRAQLDAQGLSSIPVTPIMENTARLQGSQGANSLSFLNDTATKLAKDLLSVQRQYNDDSAALAEDHTRRLDDIGANAYEQQVRMERDLVRRLTEIRAQYNQDVTDAGADYAQRLADVEADAQDRRTKVATDYADKRAKIEQDYQDRVAQIQSDYAASLFDIVARDDAKGLVRARLQRDKALADAAKARDKDLANADKDHAKQEKELNDSLERQKRQLQQDYERRLRDLAQAEAKQIASAQQNYRDQLADLNDATARQYAAENAAYARSQKALDKANADKKQALIDALVEIKGVNDEYGKAIIDSLKAILDPAQIIQLTNDLQKAFDTKIEIKVTPNASVPSSNGVPIEERNPVPHAAGGYIAQNERAYLHAGETVLPTNPMRAYQLAAQHMERVQMPLGSRGSMGASGGGVVTVHIDNAVNSALLDSQIRVTSIGVTTEIIKRGMR